MQYDFNESFMDKVKIQIHDNNNRLYYAKNVK